MASLTYQTILNQKIDTFISAFVWDSDSLFKRNNYLLHPGEYGKYREDIFKELLRIVINKDKSIADGFILTSDDNRSTQCDVIIYNTNTIPLIDGGIAKFYPVEEVNGVIEIKSELSYIELKNALRKLADIKLLSRKRRGILEKSCIISGEADDIVTFLVCKKFKFKKNLDFNEIYEGIPRRYWHNGIMSIEDGYWGYCMQYDNLIDNMKKRIQQVNVLRRLEGEAWPYPVHIEGDEVYFCSLMVVKIDLNEPYRHIMEFIVSLQKTMQLVNIYASDSIVYLGFEIDYQEKCEGVDCLMKQEKDIETIQVLNQALKTEHRVRSYDMNNIEDVKEKLKMIVAEYLDYLHYSLEIDDILERFDESMEYYDPSAWFNGESSTRDGSDLTIKTYNSVSKASTCISDLVSMKEKECRNTLETILKMDDETKIKVLGRAYPWDEIIINTIFDNITEIEYQRNIEDSMGGFLKFIEDIFLEVKEVK